MERKLVYVARSMTHFRLAPFLAAVLAFGIGLGDLEAQLRPSRRTATLPAIPPVDGPLALRVVYPPAGARVTARDSTFLFGSTGSGRASLTIDGRPVPVAPNGAFLAWLPLPDDTAATLRLMARRGGDSVELGHRLRLPRRFAPPPAGAWLDRGSIEPRGNRWAEPGEPVRVSVRAAPGAQVALRLPGGRLVPLAPDTGLSAEYGPFDLRPSRRAERTLTRYVGVFPALALGGALPAVTSAAPLPSAPDTASAAWVVVAVGADTARAPLPLRLAVVDPAQRPVVVLDDDTAHTGATRGAAIGMPMPAGTYDWFFRDGTIAAVSGRVNEFVRVPLSRTASAWVFLAEVAGTLPAGTPPPWSRVGLVRLTPGDSSVVARVTLGARIPFRVDEEDRRVTLRFYGAQSDLDWLQYGGTDPLVTRMTWSQATEDEVTVSFELSARVFGYRARWEGNDLILEIRRPPPIDPAHPLRGRTIAVDPGHPPLGATGPTGLREADANLAVGLALKRMLEEAGARVVIVRTTDTAIGLYERTTMAERANAEVLVSIHNNAFPDGVNPFENHGTSAYYFQPRASRLAFLVQDAMVHEMGLRNLGIGRGDLALVRPTWMPAVLTEGAFLMIPEQENALRTAGFQDAYARGVALGIEAYLRELAIPER
ncbi:MAG: N-acetylmuramoyl-L-alanine amidase [Gemmatimonadota bacterium]